MEGSSKLMTPGSDLEFEGGGGGGGKLLYPLTWEQTQNKMLPTSHTKVTSKHVCLIRPHFNHHACKAVKWDKVEGVEGQKLGLHNSLFILAPTLEHCMCIS